MHKTIFTFITLIALSPVACSSATEAPVEADPNASAEINPIVHGKKDIADPAVVAIDIGGEGLCSGSLVGPNWVLTARHCVSQTSESVACPPEGPQILGDRDPASLTILVGKDITTATPVAYGKRLVVPSSQALCSEDIALIQLDRAVQGVTPLEVALGGEPGVGSLIRAVGFGKRGDDLGAGKKYARDQVRVLAQSSAEFVVGEVTCNGDSGGPAFDANGAVVGVVSRGGPGCEGPDAQNIYTRVGHFASLLAPALGSSASSACGVEHHCPKGYHCTSAHVCAPAS